MITDIMKKNLLYLYLYCTVLYSLTINGLIDLFID